MTLFGQITREFVSPRSNLRPRPHWRVDCRPHVMARLKRLFSRIDKGEYGSVLLADTPENCRELLWFLDRYPMHVSPRELLEAGAQAHVAQEETVQLVLSGKCSHPLKVKMALPARDYQQVAADLAVTTGRLLLADDLGLGKTVSAITALASAGAFPALIVTLTSLPRQWARELARFTPRLSVHILSKATPYQFERDYHGEFPDVIISNYHKLTGWADTLAPVIRSVVFDEVHELRRGDSAKYSAAVHLARSAELTLGLTGTPIFNYGGEIFNVLDALSEDCLGTREEFHREWCYLQQDKPRIKDPVSFGMYLREQGLMLRRTIRDVGREMPPLTIVPHEIEANQKALDQVSGAAATLAKLILSSGEGLPKGAKFRAAEELSWKLRQATGIAKAPFVAEFVRLLVESGEQVVLFGWHKLVYDIWRERLREFNPVFFTGEESPRQKDLAIQRFSSGESKVLVISLRAGAGLDGLQHVCRTCVFGELDWSPAMHEQCIGRIFRDGQQYPVIAYFLVADSGSDPVVADVLGVKRMQLEGIRDPDAPLVSEGVDPDHVRKLAEEFLRQRGDLPVCDAPPPAASTPEKISIQECLF